MWAPVREGLVRNPIDWKWSSCKAVAGIVAGPSWLDPEPVLAGFAQSVRRSREKFLRFVAEGRAAGYDPAKHVRGQIFLGSEEFRDEAVRLASGRSGRGRATPRITGVHRPGMRDIVNATAAVFGTTGRDLRRVRRGPARKAVAWLARREGALRLPEIGEMLGIREFSASNLASEGEKLYLTDIEFRRRIEQVRARLGLV
jgi:hypothetical protein